ncbi:protein phyllopod [Calliphora vicina]|uniref:protein phyllopod n=1 Tax=Calliphora vicina TaxID=7373 RepID=UPI00325B78CA
MSEKSSEYLKRTCLICGCHTNQTINIYEPRSGPNIVQLIQAKFKFQPLNEDKYLCFSCNNWLINWHSLQALNSNDAESPSGTFRSHLNSGNVMQDEKSSGSKKQVAVCRPIAQVKPRQLAELEELREAPQQQHQEQSTVEAVPELTESNKPVSKINFNKRNFRLQLTKRGGARVQQKSMQQCACGKYMVVRSHKNSLKTPTQTALKCRKCREFSRLRACYLRSIVQVEKELAQRETPLFMARNSQNLVTEIETEAQTENECQSIHQHHTHQQQQQQLQPQPQQIRHNYLPKPSVDGKVVSMLRRLGTTLSREPQENGSDINTNTTSTLPQIMSPTKPKSKWLRPLEDDEVLVNFDTSISEVLPCLADQFTYVNSLAARKRLTFQVSETAEVIDLCDEDEHESEAEENYEELIEMETQQEDITSTFNLPKGLTITLV